MKETFTGSKRKKKLPKIQVGTDYKRGIESDSRCRYLGANGNGNAEPDYGSGTGSGNDSEAFQK